MAPPTLTRAPAFNHLRKRSTGGSISSLAELSTIAELPSPTDSTFSDATVYEDDEESEYPAGKKGEYTSVRVDEVPQGRGWSVASERKPPRKVPGALWSGVMLVVGVMAGWIAGTGARAQAPVRFVGHPTSRLPKDASEKCNPYEQHGVL